MKVDHGMAFTLEAIVRRVFSCERGGMGGYIDADHFEVEPFDAALIALAPLWRKGNPHEIEDFLRKWEWTLRDKGNEKDDVQTYPEELKKLVSDLMSR